LIRYGEETILLVEDEAKNRRVVASILESYGYTLLQAADGQESFNLSRLHVEEIDLVLLDLNMSRMTGQEALSALWAVEPAIFTELSLGKKHFLGVAGIISKPIDLKQLVRDVQEALGV
jgi:CheY-like chemotaxis protein